MTRTRHLVALAAILAASAYTSSASAFCRSTTCRSSGGHECTFDIDGCPAEGAKLAWPTSCVSYAMNKLGTQDLDPEETRAVIRDAFEAWSEVPCEGGGAASMTFEEREPVSCKKSEYNKEAPNVHVVLFQDDDWHYRGIDGTLAKTSVTYNDQTGEIYDADIEVNAANNTVTITDDPDEVEYDLRSILTHEVGHFIGIAHSPDPFAVMYASYAPGSIGQRELTPDDVDAVCAIYPPDDGVACNTEPRGGFGPTCDDPPEGGVCSVSAVGATTPASGPATASLGSVGILGVGVLAAWRRRRALSNELGGRS